METQVLKALGEMGVTFVGNHGIYRLALMPADFPAYRFDFWMNVTEQGAVFSVDFMPRWKWDDSEANREAIRRHIRGSFTAKNQLKPEHVSHVKGEGLCIVSRTYTDFGKAFFNIPLRFRDEALRLIGNAVRELRLFTQEHECSSRKHGHRCRCSSGICESITHGHGRYPMGYWEFPCYACARESEAHSPQFGKNWPFANQLDYICATCGRQHEPDVTCEEFLADMDRMMNEVL